MGYPIADGASRMYLQSSGCDAEGDNGETSRGGQGQQRGTNRGKWWCKKNDCYSLHALKFGAMRLKNAQSSMCCLSS